MRNMKNSVIIAVCVLLALGAMMTGCKKKPVEPTSNGITGVPESETGTLYVTAATSQAATTTDVTTTDVTTTAVTTTAATTAADTTTAATTTAAPETTLPTTTQAAPTAPSTAPTAPSTAPTAPSTAPTAPAPTEAPVVKPASADAAAQQLLNSGVFSAELRSSPANKATRNFALTDGSYTEFAYYATGDNAEELFIAKAADANAASEIRQGAEDYLAEIREAYSTGYRPSENPKIDTAIVYTSGDYVVFCISNDNSTARSMIDSMF